MKKGLTNDEVMTLKQNRMNRLKKEYEDLKEQLLIEEKEVNSFINYAHSIYSLSGYDKEDADGESLRSLRNELIGYCIDHIKKYKLINADLKKAKNKIDNSKISDNRYTKKLTR